MTEISRHKLIIERLHAQKITFLKFYALAVTRIWIIRKAMSRALHILKNMFTQCDVRTWSNAMIWNHWNREVKSQHQKIVKKRWWVSLLFQEIWHSWLILFKFHRQSIILARQTIFLKSFLFCWSRCLSSRIYFFDSCKISIFVK